MEVTPQIIRVYVARNGKAPYSEWLAFLKDSQARAKIRIRLDRARMGNLGDVKSVGNGVYEMRINFGPGYRVYFGREANRIIILLIAGDKHSQNKDIRIAQEFWAEYRSR